MFISRPSEPRTVLLWGDRWWLPGTGESCAFASLAEAADALAKHFTAEPKPVRLRLVFQPDGFSSAPAACPPGGRQILGPALAGDFPALGNPDHAWSHEPVQPVGLDYATILHFETEPALLALATRLAHLGLAVDSAWPLATFLNHLPDEWTDSGARTIVAVQSGRAIAYRQPRDSARLVQAWRGESTLSQIGQWLDELHQEDPSEPALVVAPDAETAGRLESCLPERRPAPEFMRLTDALARQVVIPRYHPAQLLPRGPAVTAQRMAMAASIALLLAGGWSGFSYGRNWLAARDAADVQGKRLAELRAEVDHLRSNASEIAALRSLVEGGASGPPCATFLRKLSSTLPPDVALSAVRLTRRTIEVDGWLAPAAADSTLERWREQLAPPAAAWTVAVRPGTGGSFTLSGDFRR